jgi:ribosomal-protein-alanine N-acetyltransferase
MERGFIDAVYALEERCFAIPWSKEDIRRDLTENKRALYYAAFSRESGMDVLAGYAGMWHIVNEGHINNIAVDEPYRRLGIASRLMDTLIQAAMEREMIGLTLEVRVGNRAAMGLYHKYGFTAEGIRKNYYADTKEDAIIMWKYFCDRV